MVRFLCVLSVKRNAERFRLNTNYFIATLKNCGVTWQGSEGPLGRLPQRFSFLPLSLRQQPQLLACNLLLSQEDERVGQAALHRGQVLIYFS